MNDPYINKNGVLKNKLNKKTYESLKKAEAGIGFVKLINIDSVPADLFDVDLIQRLHQHIFEDIYDWAGQFRTIPIYKEEEVLNGLSLEYSYYKNIEKELNIQLHKLNSIPWDTMSVDEKAFRFAREIAVLWKVHPFRDGNTRTMLSFAFLYAKKHGFAFDMETFTNELNRVTDSNGAIQKYSIRDKFVVASLEEENAPQVGPLANTFRNAIKKYFELNDIDSNKKQSSK